MLVEKSHIHEAELTLDKKMSALAPLCEHLNQVEAVRKATARHAYSARCWGRGNLRPHASCLACA